MPRASARAAAPAPPPPASRAPRTAPRDAPRPAALDAPRLERRTLAGATVEAIRERILSGAYPEGEPLRQDALAAALGVSRIPVREALRQLEVEGLVTFAPHRGAVVSSLSIAEIEELFELRAEIEGALALRAVPVLAPADLALADEILAAFDAAFRQHDVARWGELNWQLHAALLAPARRPVTLGVAEHLNRHADRYARMQLALTHGESRAHEEHRAIVAAARRGNAERTARLLRAHILDAGRSLVVFLRRHRGE